MACKVKRLFKISNKCFYCGVETILPIHEIKKRISNTATVDHCIPRGRGGTEDKENKVLSCIKCNNDKGHLTLGEYQAVLNYRIVNFYNMEDENEK